METTSKIYIAGHRGLVGSAIVRALKRSGYENLIVRTRAELDLLNQSAVADFFEQEKPEYVLLTAAKVGGILANSTLPGSFIYENLQIQNNIIESARKSDVRKLLFLGSSCIYPRDCAQPIKEEYLLTGPLEPTNQWYALAKIAGILMCQAYRKQYGSNFISLMPTNIYGPGDNFDLTSSHVLPALISKFHNAAVSNAPDVSVWGSGSPLREFMHVDDLADACLFLMNNYDSSEPINVGTGDEVSIKELAETIRDVTRFKGVIAWDRSKPDGTPRKLLDTSRLHALGWRRKITLAEGIKDTYQWFVSNRDHLPAR